MAKHLLKAIGLKIRERRLELGFSQEELAERCGLHRTYVGSVERGERNITIQSLSSIALALDMPLHILVQIP
jgi:transcriptional regulator with XRE-family HTH domain